MIYTDEAEMYNYFSNNFNGGCYYEKNIKIKIFYCCFVGGNVGGALLLREKRGRR